MQTGSSRLRLIVGRICQCGCSGVRPSVCFSQRGPCCSPTNPDSHLCRQLTECATILCARLNRDLTHCRRSCQPWPMKMLSSTTSTRCTSSSESEYSSYPRQVSLGKAESDSLPERAWSQLLRRAGVFAACVAPLRIPPALLHPDCANRTIRHVTGLQNERIPFFPLVFPNVGGLPKACR